MGCRLCPTYLYPDIVSKTRENILCKAFMSLNCQWYVGFYKETTQMVSLEKSFGMPGVLRPICCPQRCWFLDFRCVVGKPCLWALWSEKRRENFCLLNFGFEKCILSQEFFFRRPQYVRVITSGSLSRVQMFLACYWSQFYWSQLYHGAEETV